MAVSLVGTPTSGNTAAGTSNTLVTTLPSGWAAGDVAVLVGHLSGGTLNMSTPAGWTPLPGSSWPVTEGSSSRMYAWSRVLQSGDSAPTIAINGAMTGGWSMTAFRDGSGVAQAATSTASGTAVTLPTLAGVGAGSALLAAAHVRVASGAIPTNLSPDAAYTEVVDQATGRITSSANLRMEAAYRLTSSAGSYGGDAVTSDVTGSMVGVLVEVASASQAYTGDATVSATATLGPGAGVTRPAAATLTGLASVSAAASRTTAAGVILPATATLAPAALRTTLASATLAATATLTSTAGAGRPAGALLDVTASLAAAGTIDRPAAVALHADVALAAGAAIEERVAATVAAIADLTASADEGGAGQPGVLAAFRARPQLAAGTATATLTATSAGGVLRPTVWP
ncbi:hypothetical protein [Micromonospora aurantiaca (nom. illeg.)]|uniref:hypothetical protein n=1 Tax=Micromonospora aurantiaca (nom. illeg.) TaxID=47850 RepID=UPI0033F03C25